MENCFPGHPLKTNHVKEHQVVLHYVYLAEMSHADVWQPEAEHNPFYEMQISEWLTKYTDIV